MGRIPASSADMKVMAEEDAIPVARAASGVSNVVLSNLTVSSPPASVAQTLTCMVKVGRANLPAYEAAMRGVRAGTIDVNATDDECNKSPLILLAASYRKLEDVQYFLSHGVDINASNPHNSTALSYAAEQGWEEGVRFLLDKGADASLIDGDGDTMLLIASRAGSARILQYLVEARCDVNARNKKQETALLKAAEAGNVENVTWLLQHGALVDAADKFGNTSLMAASIEGWDPVVKVLLDNRANVNFHASTDGVTSLLMAAEGGNITTFELLLSRGAKLTDRTRTGATALHGAALSGNLAMVQRAFKAGIDLHEEDKDHTTALGWAAGEGHTDIVVWLLSRGARVNKPEESTPLLNAAAHGHEEACTALISCGANIHCTNASGMSPLIYAAAAGKVELVRLLLNRGANVYAINADGKSALQQAAAGNHMDVVDLLLKNGTPVYGGHCLTAAVKVRNVEMVNLLLKSRRATELSDTSAGSPTHCHLNFALLEAAGNGDAEIGRVLLEAQAGGGPLVFSKALENRHFDFVTMYIQTGGMYQHKEALIQALCLPSLDMLTALLDHDRRINFPLEDMPVSLLHICATNRVPSLNAELAALLIDRGADVNARDREGDTPLDYAAKSGRGDVAKLLLDRGANVYNRMTKYNACDDVALLQSLLQRGLDVNATSDGGMSIFHYAINNGLANVIPLLVQHGAEVSKLVTRPSDKVILSVVYLAATVPTGSGATIRALHAAGAELSHVASDGQTALHMAAGLGLIEAITSLIELGVDMNLANAKGGTPLHVAACNDQLKSIETLLSHGASVTRVDENGATALASAVHAGKDTDTVIAIIKVLVAKGSPIDTLNTTGYTPLMVACMNSSTKRAAALIQAGASVNAIGRKNQSPLMIATVKDNVPLVSQLLLSGASATAADANGDAPLHIAAYAGCCKDVISMLIRAGSDINALNFNHESPLSASIQFARIDYMMLLMKLKAKVDDHGSTVIHVVARHGLKEALTFLVRLGNDPHKPDDRGITPAQLAREAGHEHIIRSIFSGGPFSGWMDKLGEGLLASYKLRWVALEKGTLRYYTSPMAHKGGALPIKGNVIPLNEYAVQAIPQPSEELCVLRLIPLLALINRPNQLTWLVPDDIRVKFQGYPISRSRTWTFRVDIEFGETWYDAFAEQGACPLGPYPQEAAMLAYSILQAHLGARVPVPPGYARSLIEEPGRVDGPPQPMDGAPAAMYTFPIPTPEQVPAFRARNKTFLHEIGFKYASSLPFRQQHEMIARHRWEIVCRLTALNVLCHFVCGGSRDAREDAKQAKALAMRTQVSPGNFLPPVDADSDDENDNAGPNGKGKKESKAARLQAAHDEEISLRELAGRTEISLQFTAADLEILMMRRGDAFTAYKDVIGWRMEYMVCLAWALGHNVEPSLDGKQITGDALFSIMHEFSPTTIPQFEKLGSEPTMRPVAELVEMEDRFYCAHNAIRTAELGNPMVVPLGFAPTHHGSVVWERRHALSWMLSPGVHWDATDDST